MSGADRQLTRRLYGVSALLGAALAAMMMLQRVETDPSALLSELETLPAEFPGWSSEEHAWDSDAVTALGVDDYLLRRYARDDGARLWLYIGVHDGLSLAPGSGSPHSPLLCYPGQGWEIVDSGERQIALPGVDPVTANWLLVEKDRQRQSVLYWQQWGGAIATEQEWGDYATKLAWLVRLPGLLSEGQRTDRSLVRISSPVVAGVDRALAEQSDFARAILPTLADMFHLDLGR